MSLRIKAGILLRDGQYYGAQTTIPSDNFDVERMTNIQHGWLEGNAGTSGVGSPSYVNSFTESPTAHTTAAKVGTQFFYQGKFNQMVRYFISCNSADFETALNTTTNVNVSTTLAVATGSGYTRQN